ncbi:MAG: RagB/SusD family nutrient uptake outer membrane protein [Bacteroidales bacterium]|nr:RagB/SusD family nutrient uptake outer membrane protein [Bacteroidales bacterium]
MKKIFVFAAAALTLVSCLSELDQIPLNDYDRTSEAAYKDASAYIMGITYINAYYNFVSQGDPGSSDLSFKDAGQSELLRQWLNMNDLCTGSLDIGWGDSYITSINEHTWSNAENTAITAVYTRALKGVALVNEFLLQTEDAKLEARGHMDHKAQIAQYRAEAKFHRAMFYYILLDEFGIPPFALEENIGGELPVQKTRANLAKWIEEELLALVADGSAMPKKGEVQYPRPTQDACWALLARLYLNYEVYSGTAKWTEAKAAAKKVIDNGYTLHPKYYELFLQDNGQTCANDEFIFAIEYDRVYARSWGGTTTLSSGAFDDNMNAAVVSFLQGTAFPEYSLPYVSEEVWNGYHIDPSWVSANLEITVDASNPLGLDPLKSDRRAMLYASNLTDEYKASTSTAGWRNWKWASISSDGSMVQRSGASGEEGDTEDKDNPSWKFSSADFAIFRLPEMYYIYAEADARLNGGTTSDADAIKWIGDLRERAGLSAPGASMTVEYILKDKAAEYLWEGQRRQDEIRLGIFDDNHNKYVYPIPESDRSANPNLKQNTGY